MSPMPRFYFDVTLGSVSHADEEGIEVDSLSEAEVEARRTVGEMAQDRLLTVPNAAPENIRVEVKDEHRQPVLTVTVSIQVEPVRLTPPCGM
jgi:hypothetical protein